MTETLTIDQFHCTKLIAVDITFGINLIVSDVSSRTIIAAKVECIIFDRFDQFPISNQSVITVKCIIINLHTFADTLIQFLLKLLCFLLINKVTFCAITLAN